jgi:hypothetical protein
VEIDLDPIAVSYPLNGVRGAFNGSPSATSLDKSQRSKDPVSCL